MRFTSDSASACRALFPAAVIALGRTRTTTLPAIARACARVGQSCCRPMAPDSHRRAQSNGGFGMHRLASSTKTGRAIFHRPHAVTVYTRTGSDRPRIETFSRTMNARPVPTRSCLRQHFAMPGVREFEGMFDGFHDRLAETARNFSASGNASNGKISHCAIGDNPISAPNRRTTGIRSEYAQPCRATVFIHSLKTV